MQGWMRYLRSVVLVVVGILLYFVDVDLPISDTQVLALALILASCVWGGLEVLRQAGEAQEMPTNAKSNAVRKSSSS